MRFIRKNGHVIPIRDNSSYREARPAGNSKSPQKSGSTSPSGKPQHSVAKGAALAAGGVAVAHAAGRLGAGLVHEAAKAENVARSAFVAMRVAGIGKQTPKLVKLGQHTRLLFRENTRLRTTYWKASLGVRRAGYVTGAALIGAGTAEALKDTEAFKDRPAARAAVGAATAGGVAVGTHFVVRHAFERYMARPKGLKQSLAVVKSAATFTLRGFARKFRK